MKKILACVLALILTLGMIPLTVFVSAAEAGTRPANAIELEDGKFYNKYWTHDNYDLNCFNKIKIGKRGFITLTLEKPFDDEGEICSYDLELADSNGGHIWSCDTGEQKDGFSDYYVYKVGLAAGTYYLNVKPNFYVYSSSAPILGKYKYKFTANETWEIESNNTQTTATKLKLNTMYSGVYADESYDYSYTDYFKCNLKKGKKYTVKVWNYEELDAGTLILKVVDTSGSKDSLYGEKISGMTASFDYMPTVTGEYYILFDNDGNEAGTEYKVGVYEKATTYSITYKLNGGKNNSSNPKSYKDSSDTITLKKPTRKGYEFKGWYKDAKFKTKVTKIKKGSKGNLTLYAKWEKIYTLTYKLNGGKNNSKNPKNYKRSTDTVKLKSPTKKGYTFKGWYSDSKFKKKVTKIAKGSTGNKTLYAKWAKKK